MTEVVNIITYYSLDKLHGGTDYSITGLCTNRRILARRCTTALKICIFVKVISQHLLDIIDVIEKSVTEDKTIRAVPCACNACRRGYSYTDEWKW